MRPAIRLPTLLSIAVLVLVAVVTLRRAQAVYEGDMFTAVDERRFHGWAAGDPELEHRLASAAPLLPPGVGIRLLVPRGTGPGWATFRGIYHLPQQRVLSIHYPDEEPPPGDAWILDLTASDPRVTPPVPPASEPPSRSRPPR
ncbi:MAG TPA: hypothetical protein VM617_05955 [Thermoanaerobaculia bacterium]|nr:hypothetical protein [Thermoanaerobaculia bacterium]